MKRTFAAVALAVAVLSTLLAAPAAAHYVYQWPTVAWTGNVCMKIRSETSHGNGGGYSKGNIETLSDDPRWTACSKASGHAPYYVAEHGIQLIVMKWNAPYQRWDSCIWTNFATRTNAYSSYRDWFYNTPCGPGWYGTWTYAGAKENSNSPWVAGWVWSGSHYLPA